MKILHATAQAAAAFAALSMVAATAPEPDRIWTGPMIGDTPATLKGARVVDVKGLERLMPAKPLLVDSGPADRKPDNLPTGTLWKPTHRSIPGAVWFPGAGRGILEPAKVEALLSRIDELSGGDRSKPIVTFCQPRCWGSWNVGKRLIEQGYTAVHWFPGGTNGWQEKHETAHVEPQPGWEPKPEASAAAVR